MIFRPSVPANRETEVWCGSWTALLIRLHAGNLDNAVEHEPQAWRGAGLHLLGTAHGCWLIIPCAQGCICPSFYQAVCDDATDLRYVLYPSYCCTVGGTAEDLPVLTNEQEEKIWLPVTCSPTESQLPMGWWFSQGIKCMIYTSSPRQSWQQSAVHSTLSKNCLSHLGLVAIFTHFLCCISTNKQINKWKSAMP